MFREHEERHSGKLSAKVEENGQKMSLAVGERHKTSHYSAALVSLLRNNLW